MAGDLAEIEAELDALTIPLLTPLRTAGRAKTVDAQTMTQLLDVGDRLCDALVDASAVPKHLVGKAWFLFSALLAEADHAARPEPILDAAWEWQEKLRRAFGPTF